VVEYSLTLTNEGSVVDSFTISASGGTWVSHIPVTLIEDLEPGASATVWVLVLVPEGAAPGDSDTMLVTATSHGDPAESATSTLTTEAEAAPPTYGVELAPTTDAKSGAPGATVIYTLLLQNTGSMMDTITLGATGGWATLPETEFVLPPNQTTTVAVHVDIPAGAQDGDINVALVTAVSGGDPSQTAQSELTTTVVAPVDPPTYDVTLTPASDAKSGEPGAAVQYTLQVMNTGQVPDTFSLSASGNTWTVGLNAATTGELLPGQSFELTVTVHIPAGAAHNASDTVVVTATSAGDPGVWANSTLTTTAEAVYGVDLSPAAAAQAGLPGETVVYELTVTNEGNTTDSFAFTASGHVWSVDLPDPVTLAMGASTTVEVQVTIPANAPAGAVDTVTVAATSQNDPSATAAYDLTTLTTTAGAVYGVMLAPGAAAQTALPGAVVTYELTVTNMGNATDVFAFSVADNDWPVVLPNPVTLGMGESAVVEVTATIPAGAHGGSMDVAIVTATSAGDPTKSASSVLTTTAEAVYGVSIEPTADAKTGAPGATVQYTLQVTNDGNLPDTFSLVASGAAWTIWMSANTTGELQPGQSFELTVTVLIPAGAADGDSDTFVVTARSVANPSVTDSVTLTTTAVVEVPPVFRIFLPIIMKP
jgi:uncharacterized membrane protein